MNPSVQTQAWGCFTALVWPQVYVRRFCVLHNYRPLSSVQARALRTPHGLRFRWATRWLFVDYSCPENICTGGPLSVHNRNLWSRFITASNELLFTFITQYCIQVLRIFITFSILTEGKRSSILDAHQSEANRVQRFGPVCLNSVITLQTVYWASWITCCHYYNTFILSLCCLVMSGSYHWLYLIYSALIFRLLLD